MPMTPPHRTIPPTKDAASKPLGWGGGGLAVLMVVSVPLAVVGASVGGTGVVVLCAVLLAVGLALREATNRRTKGKETIKKKQQSC